MLKPAHPTGWQQCLQRSGSLWNRTQAPENNCSLNMPPIQRVIPHGSGTHIFQVTPVSWPARTHFPSLVSARSTTEETEVADITLCKAFCSGPRTWPWGSQESGVPHDATHKVFFGRFDKRTKAESPGKSLIVKGTEALQRLLQIRSRRPGV